ncbi:hypothetical protein BCR43DRAFT_559570 [Syncephalastrum racemosum]|uniref:F-box domain-containing protein n=1 Tax=Syncephalastrum racemosum TaxID=13706 RepID=A0A1X2HSZ6_SYNRA|nr:hypothetical protein BCR43DRAFT_559570 [Syncephalastrum racemosum]
MRATVTTKGAGCDPLQVLPYELYANIFSRLPFVDRVRCSRVSKRWRAFIYNWPDMAETIVMGPRHFWPRPGANSIFDHGCGHWLSTVIQPNTVRYFSIETDYRQLSAIVDILRRKQYTRLKTLILHHISSNPVAIRSESFLDIVLATSAYLEKLELRGVGVPMDRKAWRTIFSQCQRLTHLSLSAWPARNANAPLDLHPDDLPAELSLRHLHWNINTDFPYSVLLPKCPDLRYLSVGIRGLDITGLIPVLLRSTQTLQCLQLAQVEEPDIQWDDQEGAVGLKRLVVKSADVPSDLVASLIIAYQRTLSELVLHLTSEAHAHVCDRLADELLGPLRLECFDYRVLDRHPQQHYLYPLIDRCPRLRHLKINGFHCDERRLVHSLTCLPRLESFEASSLGHSPDECSKADVSASLPHLKKCEFRSAHPLGDYFFSHIKHLQSLQVFRASILYQVTDAGLSAFMAEAPHLKDVYLSNIKGLRDPTSMVRDRKTPMKLTLFDCPKITGKRLNKLRSKQNIELWTDLDLC